MRPVSDSTDIDLRSGPELLTDEQWRAVVEVLRLSPRESDIVRCMFDDPTEAGIAKKLGISAHTVHAHLDRMYRKLDIRSRCGLILCVFSAFVAIRSDGRRVHDLDGTGTGTAA